MKALKLTLWLANGDSLEFTGVAGHAVYEPDALRIQMDSGEVIQMHWSAVSRMEETVVELREAVAP